MRVLLISPLPELDPPCGDITYTETLLAYPPQGVEYETYAEALARGTLVEHGIRKSLKTALQTRRGLFRELLLTGFSHTLNRLRSYHWLFWEPFRFFSVKPGEYDLIHLHVFSARFFKLTCPLVVSNAAPQRYLYLKARGYSSFRTKILEQVDLALGKLLGINVNSYYLPQAKRLITFTQFLKNWYVTRNILAEDAIDTVPIFLPTSTFVQKSIYPTKIGFIAKDFAAKGGYTLLEAFKIVRRNRADAQLIIIGSRPLLSETEARKCGITWINYVPREKLLQEILPTFDVFAYPTRIDGLPLVLLEAMAQGIAIATSDYQALPEIVDEGRAGLISKVDEVEGLADNLLRLLEPDTNAFYREAARRRFSNYYSADAVRFQLRECYQTALLMERQK